MLEHPINIAVKTLQLGGIVAYPTEAVFGLGCDPFNAAALDRLAKIKERPDIKGFILIASDWSQVKHLTIELENNRLKKIIATILIS